PSVSPTNGQSQQTGQQQQPTVDTSGVLIRDVVTEAKLMTAHGKG
uniref:Uncharacterized protein n=1 Tax=Acrobeloides nanus TaxID=290746 RepID=A0A914DM20_9BILA